MTVVLLAIATLIFWLLVVCPLTGRRLLGYSDCGYWACVFEGMLFFSYVLFIIMISTAFITPVFYFA